MDFNEQQVALRVAQAISPEDYAAAQEALAVFNSPWEAGREISHKTAKHIAGARFTDSQSPGGAFCRTGAIAVDYSQLYCELFPADYHDSDALTKLYSNVFGTYAVNRVANDDTGPVDGWDKL